MGRDSGSTKVTAHAPRFFVASPAAVGDCVRLDAAQARHARVRRLRPGDVVAIFDGGGGSHLATVERAGRAHIDVRLTTRLPERAGESPCALTLAVALLKADRLEWAIEKATELGVTRIRPFLSQWSLARPSPARRARWQQIALSAAKQSGRSVVPAIDAPATFSQIVSDDGVRLFFWEAAHQHAPPPFSAPAERATVIIGPEGGFAQPEVDAAVAAGCTIVSLGPRVLRAETAAVTAVALCQSWWGDILAPLPTTP